MPQRFVSRHVRSLSLGVGALLLVLALSACSTGGDPLTGPSFEVQVTDPADLGTVALAQVMVGESILTPSLEPAIRDALAPTELFEVEPDLWLGEAVDAIAGATIEVTLPTEAELPAGTFASVEEAFLNAVVPPDCAVDASADATVSLSVFGGLTVPGLAAYTFDGSTAFAYAALSDEAIDPTVAPPDGTRFYTWIHSDGATDVTFIGAGCVDFQADLSLVAGWNFAAWVYDSAGPTLTLTNVDAPESLVATVANSLVY